jgi:predicted phage terminase large subunit-like protein
MVSARGRTLEQWESTEVATAPRFWSALFQGRPTPDVGDIWLKAWWRRYDTPLWSVDEDGNYRLPRDFTLWQSWDCAFRNKDESDYVVGQVWAKRGADSYLVTQVWKRLSFTETVDAIRRVYRLFPGTNRKIIEAKANGDAVIDSLKHEIPGITAAEPTTSKTARAIAASPYIRAGNVHIPTARLAAEAAEIAFDVEAFLHETTSFPNGAHDDQVDATSQYLFEAYLVGGEATVTSPTGILPRRTARTPGRVALSPMQRRLAERSGAR